MHPQSLINQLAPLIHQPANSVVDENIFIFDFNIFNFLLIGNQIEFWQIFDRNREKK